MYICAPCVHLVPFVAINGHWISKAGVAESCGLPCGFGELNLGPLEEQQMLSTAKQPLNSFKMLEHQSVFPGLGLGPGALPHTLTTNLDCSVLSVLVSSLGNYSTTD